MDRILIGILSLPEMLREIVSNAIVSAPDLEMIEINNADDTETRLETVDVVITAAESSDVHAVSIDLLYKYPKSSVVVLNNSATECHTYELHYRRDTFIEPSVTTLVDEIRAIASRGLSAELGRPH